MVWLRLLKRKSTTFWNLSRVERRLFVQALALLSLTAASLEIRGVKGTRRLLARITSLHGRSIGNEDRMLTIKMTVSMLRIAVRFEPLQSKCLGQSLVLQHLLLWHGIETDLQVGVRKETPRLEAHAWVEHRGMVINDTQDVHERFAAFDLSDLEGGIHFR